MLGYFFYYKRIRHFVSTLYVSPILIFYNDLSFKLILKNLCANSTLSFSSFSLCVIISSHISIAAFMYDGSESLVIFLIGEYLHIL
jgi:hypothetical protein